MKIELRSDKYSRLGFVERYSQYFHKHRRISVLLMAEMGGYFSEPYIFRGDEFIPASQIEEEMGIEKYIKAKKPFYSVIGTGNIIVSAKIAMDLDNTVYLPDKSVYGMYYLDKNSLKRVGTTTWEANLRKVSTINEAIENWYNELGKTFVTCGNDRGAFLRTRF